MNWVISSVLNLIPSAKWFVGDIKVYYSWEIRENPNSYLLTMQSQWSHIADVPGGRIKGVH